MQSYPEPFIEKIARIPSVENILKVACDITEMGFAAIARVTRDSWVACATKDTIGFGLEAGGRLKIETTICNEIMDHHQIVAIDHVDEDPVYKDHHTPRLYGLQSYISVPIILKNGDFFGTLCAIDRVPKQVNSPKVIDTFTLFAELIAFHLDAQDELAESERILKIEKRESEIKEEFIAMLGHDLRNPVNAISNAAQLQLRSDLDERNKRLSGIIRDASIRTRGLIDNILDFASGRIGGGIKLNLHNELSLEESIAQVIDELQLAWPENEFITDIQLSTPLNADYRRIAQLLSNLLGNAITHGEKGKPVKLSVSEADGLKILIVSNSGAPIPARILPHLFKPFSRGKIRPGQEGLGLGLYISKEIARAHGGDIRAESSTEMTSFIVTLP
ncbi:MAG: GAF domain-containing sensor histidine kinase [Chryseobacterium sp.]|nr:MAG: GAF domain-containing sensor histidine kinase [Chryseobacterium sp.]